MCQTLHSELYHDNRSGWQVQEGPEGGASQLAVLEKHGRMCPALHQEVYLGEQGWQVQEGLHVGASQLAVLETSCDGTSCFQRFLVFIL